MQRQSKTTRMAMIQNRMALDWLTATQGGTCAIIKIECCVYIPDLSGNVSAALDNMKNQVKSMFNDNPPFWTSVWPWIKGNWWKAMLIIVVVALLILLCGPCILQYIVWLVSLRLAAFTQIYAKRANVQYIPMSDARTRSWEHQEGGMKKERSRLPWLDWIHL